MKQLKLLGCVLALGAFAFFTGCGGDNNDNNSNNNNIVCGSASLLFFLLWLLETHKQRQ